MNINIPDLLFKDIQKYCELNNIEIEKYIIDLLRDAHNKEKYGDLSDKANHSEVKVEVVKSKIAHNGTISKEEEMHKAENKVTARRILSK